jgi:RHS repeat-associated protein
VNPNATTPSSIVPAHAAAGVPSRSPTLRGIATNAGPNASVGPRRSAPHAQRREGGVRYGSYVDEVLAIVDGAGRKYVHSNHLYSPAALTDSTGAVLERYRYDAYGRRTILAADGTTVRASSSYGFQRGFTGYHLDAETGLYYARARMYSAGLGRFISRDPHTVQEAEVSNLEKHLRLAQLNNIKDAIKMVPKRPSASIQTLLTRVEAEEQMLTAAMSGGVASSYQDGFSLYAGHFVPNALDPTGKAIFCGAASGFAAWSLGVSGGLFYCYDDCSCTDDEGKWVICIGGGIGAGVSGGIGGAVGTGCLSDGWSGQLTVQAAAGVVGGGITINPDTNQVGAGAGVGLGGGVAATYEGCYTW